MTVAALYDVHGNLPALAAALSDQRLADAQVIVSGGDLVMGPLPAECLDLLEADGRVRTQYISGSEAVHKRWVELQEELTGAGWWGPCGRD